MSHVHSWKVWDPYKGSWYCEVCDAWKQWGQPEPTNEQPERRRRKR